MGMKTMRLMVVAATVLAAFVAHADTRYELDNLLPPTDPPPSVVVQPRVDMLATATEQRHDRLWQVIDVAALAVSTAALACDWGQTHGAAADGWRGGPTGARYEDNPILGRSPSTRAVSVYFVTAAIINAGIWLTVPKRYRWIVPLGLVAVQTHTIGAAMAARTSTLCGL